MDVILRKYSLEFFSWEKKEVERFIISKSHNKMRWRIENVLHRC